MQYFIAATAAIMTCALAIGIKHRTDQSLLFAAGALALSFVTNLREVFLPVDGALASITGRYNLLGLIGTCLMVVGVYFLARAVLRASWTVPRQGYEKAFRIMLFVVLIGMIATFWMIDTTYSSTTFMRDYGGQLPAAIYSMLQFGYIGIVMVILGGFTLQAACTQTQVSDRIGASLVFAACVTAAIMVVSVYGMDIANLVGDQAALGVFAAIYGPADMLTMLLLCLGLSSFPLARRRQRRKQHHGKCEILTVLRSVHDKVTNDSSYTLGDIDDIPDVDGKLYRLVVEIRDALLRNPELELRMSETDRAAVRNAEQQLQDVTL